MTKEKILITGSGGFIFSNFIRTVLKSGSDYSIVGIDNCSNSNVLNTIYSNKSHTFHIMDVTSNTLNKVFEFERPDLVIHAAWKHNSPNENLTSTLNIVDLCQKYNCKLIYISSYEVYGESINASETDLPEPKDKDNIIRLASEVIVANSNLDYNILRLTDNIGPRQYNGFIRSAIKAILNKDYCNLNNSGEQIRDWINVQDTTAAIVTLIENWSSNEIYNVSSRQEVSILEVYKTISNSLENSDNLVLNIQLDEPKRFGADNSKLKEKGWQPTWKFKDSIRHCCHWFSNNQWFLKD